MTQNELLAKLAYTPHTDPNGDKMHKALRAIVELHNPMGTICDWCTCHEDNHIVDYPCKTIKLIELNLR